MKKRLTTPLTKEVAFCLDSFKYSEGRLIAIILAFFLSQVVGHASFFRAG